MFQRVIFYVTQYIAKNGKLSSFFPTFVQNNTNEIMDNLQIIQNKIHEIRGQKVMLDRDLAEMYGVPTKALNQAVKRNLDRFPEDFMF